jgi:DNA polymerase-3 subunit delta
MAVKSIAKKNTCDQIKSYHDEIKKARCIFIYGTDAFGRESSYKYIMQTLNISTYDEISSFLFYGDDYLKDKSIAPIMQALNMYSFDLSEKVIFIKQADLLDGEALSRLADYTESPSPYAKLVMIAEKADNRFASYKTIIKNSLVFETTTMKYAKDMVLWLDIYLKEHNLEMDYEAKNFFVNIVELDSYTAYNEMKKLELYVGKRNKITANDIKECTVNTKAHTIFDLMDAIGYRQKKRALAVAENLLENDNSLIMIITMITNFFFTLWRLDSLKRSGISTSELTAKYMNDINSYFRGKYTEFSQNYNFSAIKNAFDELYICDSRVKLSMASEQVLLANLILKIIRK